jgi:hypothetical protein
MSRRYVEVPAAEIPTRTRQAAENAAAFAAADLGIPPPVIRWFEDCGTTSGELLAGMGGSNMPAPPAGSFEEEQGILGKAVAAEPGTIWIKSHLGARRSCEVVLHECCHAFQRSLMGPAQGRIELQGREEMARTYESDSRGIARAIETTTPYEGEHDA